MGHLDALDLVRLRPLMARSEGRREVTVGLIDGPVFTGHADLSGAAIREVKGGAGAACSRAASVACVHGTLVAGVLAAKRGSAAPAICPGCALLVRPIFPESTNGGSAMPSAGPEELARALIDCVEAGARVVNLSAALLQPSSRGERQVEAALDYAAKRGVLVVAAAGNQSTVGSSAVTRHPWVIPVTGCDLQGKPTSESNLGSSIGRRGLRAPSENVTSLGTNGQPDTFAGTSAAAPFVTGAIALLWSEFPEAAAATIKLAVTRCERPPSRSLVPPMLDAWGAYEAIARKGA